jgi:hypothetical protein
LPDITAIRKNGTMIQDGRLEYEVPLALIEQDRKLFAIGDGLIREPYSI